MWSEALNILIVFRWNCVQKIDTLKVYCWPSCANSPVGLLLTHLDALSQLRLHDLSSHCWLTWLTQSTYLFDRFISLRWSVPTHLLLSVHSPVLLVFSYLSRKANSPGREYSIIVINVLCSCCFQPTEHVESLDNGDTHRTLRHWSAVDTTGDMVVAPRGASCFSTPVVR